MRSADHDSSEGNPKGPGKGEVNRSKELLPGLALKDSCEMLGSAAHSARLPPATAKSTHKLLQGPEIPTLRLDMTTAGPSSKAPWWPITGQDSSVSGAMSARSTRPRAPELPIPTEGSQTAREMQERARSTRQQFLRPMTVTRQGDTDRRLDVVSKALCRLPTRAMVLAPAAADGATSRSRIHPPLRLPLPLPPPPPAAAAVPLPLDQLEVAHHRASAGAALHKTPQHADAAPRASRLHVHVPLDQLQVANQREAMPQDVGRGGVESDRGEGRSRHVSWKAHADSFRSGTGKSVHSPDGRDASLEEVARFGFMGRRVDSSKSKDSDGVLTRDGPTDGVRGGELSRPRGRSSSVLSWDDAARRIQRFSKRLNGRKWMRVERLKGRISHVPGRDQVEVRERVSRFLQNSVAPMNREPWRFDMPKNPFILTEAKFGSTKHPGQVDKRFMHPFAELSQNAKMAYKLPWQVDNDDGGVEPLASFRGDAFRFSRQQKKQSVQDMVRNTAWPREEEQLSVTQSGHASPRHWRVLGQEFAPQDDNISSLSVATTTTVVPREGLEGDGVPVVRKAVLGSKPPATPRGSLSRGGGMGGPRGVGTRVGGGVTVPSEGGVIQKPSQEGEVGERRGGGDNRSGAMHSPSSQDKLLPSSAVQVDMLEIGSQIAPEAWNSSEP